MSDKTNNGPAFPSANDVRIGELGTAGHPGMTLRDYFAAKAMQALIVARGSEIQGSGWPTYAEDDAYKIADAMLDARSGT